MLSLNLQINKCVFSPGKNVCIFSNCEFTSKSGEIIAIVGISGSGKTTLLNIISEYFSNSLKNTLLNKLNPFQRLNLGVFEGLIQLFVDSKEVKMRDKISHLPQELYLFNSASILSNLSITGKNKDDYQKILSDFGLGIIDMNILVDNLSGGERQRIGIARTLLQDDKLIYLFDEPFNGIDYINKRKILDYIYKYIKLKDKICFIVTHDIHDVLTIADKIIVFYDRFKVKQYESQILKNSKDFTINKLLYGDNLIEFSIKSVHCYIKPQGLICTQNGTISYTIIQTNQFNNEFKVKINIRELKKSLCSIFLEENIDIISDEVWLKIDPPVSNSKLDIDINFFLYEN